MNNKDEIAEKFVKAAESFALQPSPGVWSNIEKDIALPPRKKRKGGIIIIFSLLVLSSALLGYFLISTHTSNNSTIKTSDSMTHGNPTRRDQNTIAGKTYKEPSNVDSIKNSKTDQHKTQNLPFKAHDFSKAQNHLTKTSDTSAKYQLIGKTSNNIEVSGEVNPSISKSSEPDISIDAAQNLPDKVIHKDIITAQNDLVKDTLEKDSLADSFASKKTDKVAGKSSLPKWSIGLFVGGSQSFTKIQEAGDYQFIKKYRDSTDKDLLALNYGLNFSYDIIPNVTIYAGPGITQYKQKILSRQMVYRYDTTPATSPFHPPVIIVNKDFYDISGDSAGSVRNSFTYLNIPLGIRYNFFPGKKFGFSLQAEISINRLINAKGYIYNKEELVYTNQIKASLKPWMISYSFGIPIHYKVYSNLTLELIPVYGIYQGSVYKSSYTVSQKFQQMELLLGFRYAFH